MAYKQVKQPRVYINVPELISNVTNEEINDLYRTLPTQKITPGTYSPPKLDDMYTDKSFVAWLGHEAGNNVGQLNLDGAEYNNDIIVNATSGESPNIIQTLYNGFSIRSFDSSPLNAHNYNFATYHTNNAMSCVIGNYYDLDNPNLSLNQNIIYDNPKENLSYIGASYSNSITRKPPNWGNLPPWVLGKHYTDENWESSDLKLARHGRREWQLSWSHMDQNKLFSSNTKLAQIGTGAAMNMDQANFDEYDAIDLQNDGNDFAFNIYTDSSVFSQIWNNTLAGSIPMLFQPDNTNFNSDQWAIVIIKENSFKATRNSFNTYTINLTFQEIW